MSKSKKKVVEFRAALYRGQTSYELGMHACDVEYPNSDSMTVPDMVDPLATLLGKLVRGQAVPINEDPYYHGDLPDLDRMDKVDREMYKREVYQRIKDAQQTIKERQEESKRLQIADQRAEIERLRKKEDAEKDIPPEKPVDGL
jgi:hypothetical protein